MEVRDGEPAVCGPGALVLHSAEEEHADYFYADAFCLNVELPGEFDMPQMLRHTSRPDSSLRRAVAAVVREFNEKENPASLEDATATLQHVLRTAPAEAPPLPHWLRSALDIFAWTEAVPTREAAKIAGVHPTHFSREFHRYMSVTPNRYRSLARMRLASTWLLNSTAPLSHIALHCGYTDQSHFNRAFRESTGISPAHYRKLFFR